MSFEIGDRFGDYQIIGVLGAGGMGKVYKVKNLLSDRMEAMKVLLPDLANEPELADRFLGEIKVLASLNHPNIAGLHTAFRLENQLLMIMEFVQGTTLEDKLKDGPFSLPDAIDYACQVLSALGYAHSQGVIHRDIKPANMMLTPENVIKLMDFGIAKSKADRNLTMTGTTLGSAYYMPPEQVQGTAIDARSDLYSLGVSLYEMVTGSRPFKGDRDYDLMVAQSQKAPMPPMAIQTRLPQALNDIIMISLEKDPARRFQAAEAFRFALQSVKDGLTSLPVASVQAVVPGLAGQPATPSAAFSATGVLGAQSGQPADIQLQPTTPSQTAMPPAQPQAGPPPPVSRRYRGFYMTLGALVAIVVIVLGAMQLPRLFKAKAGGTEQAAQQAASTATNPSSSPAQSASANVSQEQPSQPVSTPPSQTTAAQGGTASSQPSEPLQGSSSPLTPAPDTGGSKKRLARGSQGQKTASDGQIYPAGGPAGQAPQEAAAPPGGVSPAVQAPADDAAVAKELEDLGDRMTLLAGRASAMNDSVQNLRRQQSSAGYSLRPDISASQSRMEQDMGKADAALNSRAPEAAKKYMDQAEQEIEKLEKFFGR
jgi:serine/threonine-protein kinase